MRWQRAARWVVAAIGIGCAIAIAATSRRRPDPPKRPPELVAVEPNVSMLGGAGQRLMFRHGQSTITINFTGIRSYDDGRLRFERVVIEGLEESRFKVEAKVMEASAPVAGSENPKTLNLSGGVRLTTDDGLELTSDTASWDDPTSQLTMPGPVTFKKGRLSGSGVGATYDREKDAFTLLEDAKAHVDADKEGHGAADLSAAKMTLVRGQHTVQLLENAKIVGEVQTLTAREATLSFKEDDSAVKYLELRGAARVAPNPGVTSNKPTMNADNITMAFYEDGVTLQHATLTGQGVLNLTGASARSVRSSWIDFDLAPDGQTLTSLRARDRVVVTLAPTATTPGRTITSNTLEATGDAKKGLTSARFEGSPRFDETAAAAPQRGAPAPAPGQPLRSGTAVILVLTLGGQLDAIERAEFQQNAQFRDGDVMGEADIAQYDEANGKLHLLPNPRGPRKVSNVTTPDMTVHATSIDVDTESDDLQAQGAVVTSSRKGAGTAKPGALFGGKEPIIGSAETLVFTKSSGTAVYTGAPRTPAQLRQGDSQVVGDRIEYEDTTRNLNARGHVDSKWLLEPTAGGAPKPQSQTVRADTMTYDEAKRTAVYTGSPVHVTTDDGVVEGRTVTFLLAAESRALETMRAERAVWATLSGGYEAVGDVLVYDAKTESYTVTGRAGEIAQVKTPKEGSPPSNPICTWTEGMRLLLNRKTNNVSIPGTGQAPQSLKELACSVPLRSSK